MTDLCEDCGENVAVCEFTGIDETVYWLCAGCQAHAEQALEDCWAEEAEREARRMAQDWVDPGVQDDDFSADEADDEEEDEEDYDDGGWESEGPLASWM